MGLRLIEFAWIEVTKSEMPSTKQSRNLKEMCELDQRNVHGCCEVLLQIRWGNVQPQLNGMNEDPQRTKQETRKAQGR